MTSLSILEPVPPFPAIFDICASIGAMITSVCEMVYMIRLLSDTDEQHALIFRSIIATFVGHIFYFWMMFRGQNISMGIDDCLIMGSHRISRILGLPLDGLQCVLFTFLCFKDVFSGIILASHQPDIGLIWTFILLCLPSIPIIWLSAILILFLRLVFKV